jgi:hypothetical protein
VWVFKRKCFSKWVWWRVVTLITLERDDQGLPSLGESLRWWLSWFRCEHEGLSLSLRTSLSSLLTYTLIKYNLSRLYGQSLDLNLYGPNPGVMLAGEHRENKEGECFVRFGHGGGLTPSGIIVKVRTCKERERFGIQISRRWDCRNRTNG